MEYKYYLPGENNQKTERITNNNSIIIIGANGSGKTHLGVWIEKSDYNKTYRIGAQRALKFGEYITQKSYEQSTNELMFGKENYRSNHDHKYNWDGSKYNYYNNIHNDYENVLSALLAKQNIELKKYVDECKERDSSNKSHNAVPTMVLDNLYEIWNSVFPQRNIVIDDGKVTGVLNKDGCKISYIGNEMSDGERVALYLISQALCIPENRIVIVDEPEIHLHPSIMNKLWQAIENIRMDCLFVYITHDVQFAANHINSEKIWVKSFDGKSWKYEFVGDSELPEDLLLMIMGNRKPVLFVEGTSNSYDTKLYQLLYPEFFVIPCGNCTSVITNTKSMNSNQQLHHLKCYGLIDQDYRTEREIELLNKDNIFTLNVAEVENLFLVKELIEIIANHMCKDEQDVFKQIKEYVISNRFKNQIESQICKSVIAEIKYLLSVVDINYKNEEEIKAALDLIYESIDFDSIKKNKSDYYHKALDENDYNLVLQLFNEKGLSKSIGHFFGINDSEYCNIVLSLINTEKRSGIVEALSSYVPQFNP